LGGHPLDHCSGLRAGRSHFDPADLYAGVAKGDAHDASDRAAATTASSASSGRGSENRQAGGQAHPARKADAAAGDPEAGGSLQGSGTAARGAGYWGRAGWRGWRLARRPGLGSSGCGPTAASSGCPKTNANQTGRTGGSGQACCSAAAGLSASRTAGAHSGQRSSARDHR